MAEYSRDEIKKMQQDAVRRVQDMQQHARRTMNNNNSSVGNIKYETDKNKNNKSENNNNFPESDSGDKMDSQKNENSGISGLLGGLGSGGFLSGFLNNGPAKILDKLDIKAILHDSDTVMTLAILLLVSAKDSDPILTLALIYIML